MVAEAQSPWRDPPHAHWGIQRAWMKSQRNTYFSEKNEDVDWDTGRGERDKIRLLPWRTILVHAAVYPASHLLLDNNQSESPLSSLLWCRADYSGFCLTKYVAFTQSCQLILLNSLIYTVYASTWITGHHCGWWFRHLTPDSSNGALQRFELTAKGMKRAENSPGCCSGSKNDCKLSCDSTGQTENIWPVLPVDGEQHWTQLVQFFSLWIKTLFS